VEENSLRPLLIEPATLCSNPRPTPNLPILTRAGDIACALPQPDGRPGVLVPHATIAAMQDHRTSSFSTWAGDATAIDLWVPLMRGATVSVGAPAIAVAA
jgi:hypothetical protein